MSYIWFVKQWMRLYEHAWWWEYFSYPTWIDCETTDHYTCYE